MHFSSPRHTWDTLQKLGISKATRRGCIAGQHVKSFSTSHFRNTFLQKDLPIPDQNNAKQSLKVGLFNARSLCNKVGLVIKFIKECSLDLLCVTETWLRKNDKAKTREMHELGFEISSKPRLSRGGSVAFLFKPDLPVKHQKIEIFKSFEVTEAIIFANKERMKICVVYRPGNVKQSSKFIENITSLFWTEFNSYLANIFAHFNQVVLCGDFDFHLENNTGAAHKILVLVNMHGFDPLLDFQFQPTHDKAGKLDAFFVSENPFSPQRCLRDLSIKADTGTVSDHYLVTAILGTDVITTGSNLWIKKLVRNFKDVLILN